MNFGKTGEQGLGRPRSASDVGHAVTPCPSHALGSLPGPCYGLVGLVAPLSVYLARALCATESPETCALHLHAFALVTASPPPPFLTCSEKRHRASWAKSVCALGKTWVLRRLWCEGSSSIMTPQSMTPQIYPRHHPLNHPLTRKRTLLLAATCCLP